MKSIFGLATVLCMFVGFSAERASADVIYDLEGVNFKFGNTSAGELAGSFTTGYVNNQLAVIAANLIAPYAKINNGTVFEETTYTVANSTITLTNLGQDLQIVFARPDKDKLTLIFVGGLKTTGSTDLRNDSSQEHQNGVGNRRVVEGSVAARDSAPVAAVPEPSPLAVISICVPVALGFALRRRRLAAAAA